MRLEGNFTGRMIKAAVAKLAEVLKTKTSDAEYQLAFTLRGSTEGQQADVLPYLERIAEMTSALPEDKVFNLSLASMLLHRDTEGIAPEIEQTLNAIVKAEQLVAPKPLIVPDHLTRKG